MSQRCTVCHHQERDAIDRALVSASASNRSIATQHDLSEAAVRRHKDAHLPSLMALAHQDAQATHELDLGVLVRRLVGDAHRIREKAEHAGDYRAALQGIRELTRLIELARDTAEVQPEQQRTVRVVWDMGGGEVTPDQAHDLLRAAEADGTLPLPTPAVRRVDYREVIASTHPPLPHSEQPATVSAVSPSPAAQSAVARTISAGLSTNSVDNSALDNNARAESHSQPRTRRRRYP